MLKVHGAGPSPFVRKVRVTLLEKNVPYELNPVFPFGVSDEFKKISPLGKIPVLEDDGRTLPDSSVIVAYLERKHPTPSVYPTDPYQYGRALWFEEYADSAVVGVLGAKIFLPKIVAPRFLNRPLDQAAVDQALAEDVPPLFDYLESQLTPGPWLAGDTFSVGDIAVASQLVNFGHAGYSVDAKRWPKLADFARRAHARASFAALIEEERAMFPPA